MGRIRKEKKKMVLSPEEGRFNGLYKGTRKLRDMIYSVDFFLVKPCISNPARGRKKVIVRGVQRFRTMRVACSLIVCRSIYTKTTCLPNSKKRKKEHAECGTVSIRSSPSPNR
jgi:hypothetical protein